MDPLTLLFDPRGTINRRDFSIGFLISLVLVAFFIFAPMLLANIAIDRNLINIFKLLTAISYLIGLVISLYTTTICLPCKRFRSIGVSAWWVLILFVPIVGLIVFIALFIIPPKVAL